MAAKPPDNGRRGFVGRLVDSVVAPVVQPVVNAVDVEHVVERVDINAVLDRIELDDVLDRIDPNRLLDRIDAERLLDRIDPERLLDRIDPNRLLDRVDPDRLLDRVDTDRLMARIDVDALVKRTELGDIIARSTTGVFGQLLDVGRATVMSVDLVVQGVAARVLHRPDPALQRRPDDPDARTNVRHLRRMERAVAMQRHYAGSPSRFLAFLVDMFVSSALFSLGAALFTFALEVVTGAAWVTDDHRLLLTLSYVVWQLIYLAVPIAATGRTIGKAILGLMVLRSDGKTVDLRRAVLRTAVFPLSFLLFGIGFLVGLVRVDRRQLHDLIADTTVVYAWDADVASMRANAVEGVVHTNP